MGVFSPDGSRFAYISPNDTLDILNFDRCTGQFSNPTKIITPDTFFLSVAFSPSSQYLYVGSQDTVLQFDLYSSNINSSQIVVGVWDSTYLFSLIPTYFFMSQLAPDGKIYFGTWNGSPYLDYIDQPDSSGLSCNFQLNFNLPQFNIGAPSFPNYDLGALEGSPCDTIGNFPTSTTVLKMTSFRISPNPVSPWLNIIHQSSDDALFELFDINGHRVAAVSLYHYFRNRLLNMIALPAGVYLAAVTENGKRVWSEKVVVGH